MIVDAHAHIFRRCRGRIRGGPVEGAGFGRVRIGDSESVQLLPPVAEETSFPPEVLVESMNWAGIDQAVLLQGPFYGERNGEVAEAVARWPDRFLGAAYVDPWEEGAREVFARAVERQAFRVVKLELSESTGLGGLRPGLRLDDPALRWLWAELETRSMVLTLDLGAVGGASYQTAELAGIVEERPGLRVVIAHLAQPTPDAERDPRLWRSWERQIRLGERPNVWFDTAALPHRASAEGWPYPSVRNWIRRAAELIGSGKILWGSDVPGVLTLANHAQLLELARYHLDFLPQPDQRGVLGENALRVYPFGARRAAAGEDHRR